MFDKNKLAAWLGSLQVETHFPNCAPQRVIEPETTELDKKMDQYDIFVQGNFNYNHGTAEFPVYGPKPSEDFMPWLPGGANLTYGSLGFFRAYVSNMMSPIDEAPAKPQETPYSRFKAKMTRLATAPAAEVANPAPTPPERSPDFVHTLTAWRGWGVSDGELEALGIASKWEPRRAHRAGCRVGRSHAAPALDCNCGYWSFKSRELLEQAMEHYATSVDVIGEVEIWGRVIECENGWRSEYAYPKELWLLGEGLESLSWKYGVPVRRLG
jgi:hypothetical protein